MPPSPAQPPFIQQLPRSYGVCDLIHNIVVSEEVDTALPVTLPHDLSEREREARRP